MSDDITDQAERVLRLRWEQPGPDYPEPVPTGLVWLGDWASEHLGELVAELKTTRAQRDEFHAQLDDALKDYEAVRAELIDMVPPEVIDMPLEKSYRQAQERQRVRSAETSSGGQHQ